MEFLLVFSALRARDAKCHEEHGTVPNNEDLPLAITVREASEPLFTPWSKPFQNFPRGYMLFICNIFYCITCKVLFVYSSCLLVWPFALDSFHLSLRSTRHHPALHPEGGHACTVSELPSDVPLDSSKGGTCRRL